MSPGSARCAGDRCSQPACDRHVGALALPDDAERADDGDDAAGIGAAGAELLDRDLRARIPAEGMQLVGLVRRAEDAIDDAGAAVDGGRGRDDHGHIVGRAREDVSCRVDVVAPPDQLDVGTGAAHSRTRREMEHEIGVAEHVVQERVGAGVDEVDAEVASRCPHRHRASVDAGHGRATSGERLHEVRADEACAPGDDGARARERRCAHRSMPRPR